MVQDKHPESDFILHVLGTASGGSCHPAVNSPQTPRHGRTKLPARKWRHGRLHSKMLRGLKLHSLAPESRLREKKKKNVRAGAGPEAPASQRGAEARRASRGSLRRSDSESTDQPEEQPLSSQQTKTRLYLFLYQ